VKVGEKGHWEEAWRAVWRCFSLQGKKGWNWAVAEEVVRREGKQGMFSINLGQV
jgi:hypothetical protein